MVKTKKKISVIPVQPKYEYKIQDSGKKIRVAAYCRVSTSMEQQELSYEAQVAYYTEKIRTNPQWNFAGIYADDGKSATNTRKRDDFNALIKDCMAGKIDMVLTKSISRFARNTVDSLQTIRMLKEKNIPILFEKEHINTLESNGELLITVLSSQAQEESRNISENVQWGVKRKFENGVLSINHNRFLGYTKNENGELVIVPEEAKIIKKIFRLFLEGNTTYQIKRQLEAENIKTVTGLDKWHASCIDRMLSNEKYMGDALLQKTYTVDFLTKKRLKNDGVVPQYYIQDNHEAIIPKELFYMVQQEKARRSAVGAKKVKCKKSKYSSKYVLSDIMVCGECGQPYRRTTWTRYGEKLVVWRCNNRLKNGTKHCKNSPTMKEKQLHEAIINAINGVIDNENDYVSAFRENVILIMGSYTDKNKATKYDKQIENLQNEMLKLIEENAKKNSEKEEFEDRYKEIAEQIQTLKKERLYKNLKDMAAESDKQRVNQAEDSIQKEHYGIREFDEELVRQLLKQIKVIHEGKIEIQFKSGIVMEQRVDIDD